MESTIGEHIEITPGVCGGKPRIVGHRIRVQDIVVWHERQGRSPVEIVADFPQITLADVYAALAYYYDHQAEIERQMKEGEQYAEALRATTPSLLREKLMRRDGNTDALPSG